MPYEDNRAGQHTDEACQGNDQADRSPRGTGLSIRPATTVPPTVLMTELDNGTLILQGRPDGPRVWLEPAEARPLRYELVRAFNGSAAFTTRNDEGDAP